MHCRTPIFKRPTLEKSRPAWRRAAARIWALGLLLGLACFSILKTQAATVIWDGGGTNAFWDTVVNWSTDALPANGDTVQFSSGLGSGSAINLNGNRTAATVIINTLSAFSLTNSTLTITSGDITRNDIAGTEADHTITSAISLGGDGVWTVNGSGNLIASGVISGARKLTKAGTGTLVLSGANTYSGLTTVSAGVLNAQNDAAFGTTAGGVSVTSGAAIQLQGGIAVGAEALTLNGSGISSDGALRNISGNNSWAGAVTLGSATTIASDSGTLTLSGAINNGGGLLTVDGASDTTLGGVISGTGGFTKTGVGSLTLNGSALNTYTGNTAVNQGILYLNSSVANGAITDTLTIGDGVGGEKADIVRHLAGNQIDSGSGSGLILKNSGWLDLNGYSDTLKITSLEGGWITTGLGTLTLASHVVYSASGTSSAYITGNLALGANRNFTVNDGSAADDLVISADISGAFTLTKKSSTATGRLVLSGNNSYTGLTTLEGGSVRIESSNALGTTAAGTVINSGAALEMTGDIAVGAEALTLSGTGISGGGALLNLSGSNSWAGDLTLGAASTIGSDAGTLSIGGNVVNGGFLATFAGAGNQTVSGVISGTGGLTKSGAGTLTLSGTNTFSGGTTINAGKVLINNSNSLGATGVAATINSGTLEATATLSSSRNFTLGASASTIEVDPSKTFTVSGIMSGTGGLTKTGTGTLTLSGTSANTFSGVATVNAGTLVLNKTAGVNAFAGALTIGDGSGGANADVVQLNADNQIPGVTVTINNSGLLDLNGYSDTIGALTMTGGSVTTGVGTLTLGGNVTGNADSSSATISGNLGLGANRTFTIADGAASTDMSISAVVSGAFTVTKTGSGTLVLSGTNTYTGATTISNGVVNIENSAGFGTTAGGVTVISGAEAQLQGNISVGGEALTLNGSGVSSGGALRNISGNNSWSGGVTLGSASTIASDSGTLTLSGNITNGGFASTFTGAGNVTASGVISGTGGLTKSGAGTLTLSGADTFTGAVNVSAGTLQLGAADRIADTVNVTLSGGTLNSGGFNETVGTLTLTADSIIDFGSGASVIHFSSSAAASWTAGKILTITNWSGPYAGGGTDQLFFGTGITGLTGSQLGQIQFVDNAGHRQLANILSTGEVVPIPEPATVVGMILMVVGLCYRERKNLCGWIRTRVNKPQWLRQHWGPGV